MNDEGDGLSVATYRGLTMPNDANTLPPAGLDDRGLAKVVEDHRAKLLAMVQRYLGGRLAARIDAEGVLHDAYLRALPRWRENPPPPEDCYCRFYGIVRDQVLDEIRKAMGPTRSLEREIALPQDSVAEIVLGMARSQTGASGFAIRRELDELLRKALEELKFRDFEIIQMRVFADLNFRQIGEILGEPENTVTRRFRRALVKLMALLPEIEDTPSRS